MIEKTKGERIRRIYNLALSVWTVIVGALFILQTWRIYFTGGKSPFTTENIGEKLSQIAIPAILWIVAIIGGAIVNHLFPKTEKTTAYIDVDIPLQRLQERLPQNGEQVIKERKIRFWLWIASATVAFVLAVMAIALIVDKELVLRATKGFFASHGEAERILRALVWIALAFAVIIAVTLYDSYSKRKEIALLKAEMAARVKNGEKLQPEKKQTLSQKIQAHLPFLESKYWEMGLRIGVAVLGIVLVIVGIMGGGMSDVLEKAVKICTQCIGLG